MKLNTQGITRKFARQVLVVKKNSPHIFFVGGVVGLVGTTVLACRATLKVGQELEDIKNDVVLLKTKAVEEAGHDLSEPERKTLSFTCTSYATVKTIKVVGRLYGPALLLGGASVAALTGSHIQLTRRNAALTAAFAAMSKAFDEYRERVQSVLGKEKEASLYHNAVLDVNKKGDKDIVKFVNGHGYSQYSRFFDQNSRHWKNDPELNRLWIEVQQNYLNHKLQADGHVFLNAAYEALGMDPSSEGQIVGWLLNGDGDGYVDFGLYLEGNMVGNNLSHSILLDFNVDGIVFDKI